MREYVLISLLPPVMILAGFVLLWARSWLYVTGRVGADDVTTQIMTACAWALLVLGLLAALTLLTNVLVVVAIVVAAIVFWAAVYRYRETERRSLLWLLMTAAERGIPLETAAAAFADERNDAIGRRARLLADYLEAGVPLADALRRSHHRPPTAALLAAELGGKTGMLGPSLRQVMTESEELETALRWSLEKLFYLACLLGFIGLVLTFLMIKIIPAFDKIMSEFQTPRPGAAQALFTVVHLCVAHWYLGAPLFIALLVAVVFAVRCYVGFPPRDLWLVRRLWRPSDGALVLRWLAVAVRQQRPLLAAVQLLADSFPTPPVRTRLAQAAQRINDGLGWCQSLEGVGIIRPSESAIFQAAERTGNLAWTLEEMADSRLRRMAYRLQGWTSVAFPIAVIAVGAFVFWLEASILMSLAAMIRGVV